MSIVVKDYGVTKDGEQIRQYILENANGMKAVSENPANLQQRFLTAA